MMSRLYTHRKAAIDEDRDALTDDKTKSRF